MFEAPKECKTVNSIRFPFCYHAVLENDFTATLSFSMLR